MCSSPQIWLKSEFWFSDDRVDSIVSSLPRVWTNILGMSDPAPGKLPLPVLTGDTRAGGPWNDSELQILNFSRKLSLDLFPRLTLSSRLFSLWLKSSVSLHFALIMKPWLKGINNGKEGEKEAEKLKSREMKEGWRMNEEWWRMMISISWGVHYGLRSNLWAYFYTYEHR